MLGTIDQLSVSHDEGQHTSVQDAHKPGVDSVWELIPPTPCEIILNTISKGRMAQIYSVKYIRSLDLPKPTV